MSAAVRELWRWIPGCVGKYQASNIGAVRGVERIDPMGRRVRARVLTQILGAKAGYYQVSLWLNGALLKRSVHVLVKSAFAGPPPAGSQCRHLNGVKTDNRTTNLRWGTRAENYRDSVRHGTAPIGERHGMARLCERQVREIRALCAAGLSQRAVASRFGVGQSAVWSIVQKKNWTRTAGEVPS